MMSVISTITISTTKQRTSVVPVDDGNPSNSTNNNPPGLQNYKFPFSHETRDRDTETPDVPLGGTLKLASERIRSVHSPIISFSISSITESRLYTIILFIFTFHAVFSGDLWILAVPKSSDIVFQIGCLITFVVFSFDLATTLYYQKKTYLLSSFFMLDLLACISLIPDFIDLFTKDNSDFVTNASLSRASKAARSASRVGRLVRMLRMLKVFSMVQGFFRSCYYRRRMDSIADDEEWTDQQEYGTLASKLMQNTTSRLIVLVLFVYFMQIIIEELQEDPDSAATSALYFYKDTIESSSSSCGAVMESSIKGFWNSKLVLLEVPGRKIYSQDDLIDSLRTEESIRASYSNINIIINRKRAAQLSAMLNIVNTICVFGSLVLANFFITRDITVTTIDPIRRMIKTLHRFRKNPFRKLLMDRRGYHWPTEEDQETTFLERSLAKIGRLLQVGFGIAGGELITHNLEKTGKVNVMIPGTTVQAVFGFCDIRGFTEITEMLGKEVMPFVNEIASHVHDAAINSGGFPNKNIGDAWLLVWRLNTWDPDELSSLTPSILCEIIKSMEGIAVNEHLQASIKQYNLPAISLGWGLHIGWAIEGAIGSQCKVDPSYLSPHVNLSARLESATKQYGVPLLMSGDFAQHLPETLPCRRLDRIMPKGVKDPVDIYTLCNGTRAAFSTMIGGADIYGYAHSLRQPSSISSDHKSEERAGMYKWDVEVRMEPHEVAFEEGCQLYLDGQWAEARTILERCQSSYDPPPKVLLDYMSRTNFVAPLNWPGYRKLDEK